MIVNPVHPRNKQHEDFLLFDYLRYDLGLSLGNTVKEVVIKKNDYIYCPPTQYAFVYEIVEGVVKLGSYNENGEESTYDVVYEKDFFGNLKYLNNQFFEFSKALVDTRIRMYELHFFKKTIIEEPVIAEWFISYLVKRWCIAEKKLIKINERTTQQKVQFLQSSFNIKVKDIHGEIYLLYDLLTQKDLGDLIGATRQTIANTLKKISIPT
ncbi:MAG: Crp/Fnr family transcriptional regulator [Saonia sp.]